MQAFTKAPASGAQLDHAFYQEIACYAFESMPASTQERLAALSKKEWMIHFTPTELALFSRQLAALTEYVASKGSPCPDYGMPFSRDSAAVYCKVSKLILGAAVVLEQLSPKEGTPIQATPLFSNNAATHQPHDRAARAVHACAQLSCRNAVAMHTIDYIAQAVGYELLEDIGEHAMKLQTIPPHQSFAACMKDGDRQLMARTQEVLAVAALHCKTQKAIVEFSPIERIIR